MARKKRPKIIKAAIRNGYRVKGNAHDIAVELDSLAVRKGKAKVKELRPKDVVAAAEDPDSAMHDHFEWDDSEAAEKYRLDQARYIMRSITITYSAPEYYPPEVIDLDETEDGAEEITAPMFSNVSRSSLNASEPYLEMVDVLADDTARAALVEEARGEIARFKNSFNERYGMLKELEDELAAIAKL